jgi:hypothetical protein
MSNHATPCLTLAIARLSQTNSEHFATWVIQSPVPGGYVHHDCLWPKTLTEIWLAWQEMFSLQGETHMPVTHLQAEKSEIALKITETNAEIGYGGQLMQYLGMNLWEWLFDGPIRQSLAQSRGIAIGKNQPLRIRLEIRDPNLISLPWEIMQQESGRQSISLNPQILFSRTTTNVDPLPAQPHQNALKILLVLGENLNSSALGCYSHAPDFPIPTQPEVQLNYATQRLQLEAEASTLTQVIAQSSQTIASNAFGGSLAVTIETLIQPTAADLTEALDQGNYNVFFYGGHGMANPDGGSLFLCPQGVINGTELAQVLVRNRVTLAVFNACWGAQPAQKGSQTLERSSLAEVLIHHGVPAVLGMRDSITDQEALSFIQAFTRALTQRMSIDQSVKMARQQLLTLYKFNQPAWTLPILYMHPEFDGTLIEPLGEGITELPMSDAFPVAYLRFLTSQEQGNQIQGGLMRVGRHQDNDVVIHERWVSQKHAEIICRENEASQEAQYTYYLRDFSRFGTFIYSENSWQKVHYQEVPLKSGYQLKFGSINGQTVEFIIID